MSNLAWLAVGFAVVWLAIGIYLLRLWRAQRVITQRLEELTARRSEGERNLG